MHSGKDSVTIPCYHIHGAQRRPEFKGRWDGPAWSSVPIMSIDQFRPEGSDHRPDTQAKLVYSPEGLYGLFRVHDRYVRCIHRRYQDPVYNDSCVEFFFQPQGAEGYFNFEFNCGGALLTSYIVDPTRTDCGFKDFIRIPKTDAREVMIYHSQPRIVDPECVGDTTWYLEFYIPRFLIERVAGPIDLSPGTIWRANLYKCGDQTSHPHWAAWAPVDTLNFHLPRCFGQLRFMP